MMPKPIQDLELALRFEKARVLAIKLGLVKLLNTLQHLVEGLRGIQEDRPLTIAQDEFMHGLATMNLPLARAETPEERFQFIVGAVAFRPSIAREQTWPSLPKGGTDMCNPCGVDGMMVGMLFQLIQEGFDPTLDLATRGARVPCTLWRVKQAIQLHQPVPLAVESPILRHQGLATLHHSQQLIQQRMPPF